MRKWPVVLGDTLAEVLISSYIFTGSILIELFYLEQSTMKRRIYLYKFVSRDKEMTSVYSTKVDFCVVGICGTFRTRWKYHC